MDLCVRTILRPHPEVYIVELADPSGEALPPQPPGAHLALTLADGALRRYSLCTTGAAPRHYRIGIRVSSHAESLTNRWLAGLCVGDQVTASVPRNAFPLDETASDYLLIGGGIGITPLVPMACRLAALGKPTRVVYLVRERRAAVFHATLAAAAQAAPTLRVELIETRGQGARTLALPSLLGTPRPGRQLYCCGPEALMQRVREASGDWPAGSVHFERFSVPPVAAVGGTEAAPAPSAEAASHRISIPALGIEGLDAPPGRTILETLRANGIDADSSCESGTCRTCQVRVLAGTVVHNDFVLSEAERCDTALICVAYPQSATLVLAL